METFFKLKILPFFLHLMVRVIYLTNKKVYHHTKLDDDKPVVIAFWHGDLLMQPFNYKKLKPKGFVKAIISNHKDGEIITNIVTYLGIGAVRGSSSKGGAKALISTIRELKAGNDIAITPDGPRGPRFSVADGIVAISKKAKAKIVVFNCKPTKYWQMKSWDKFIVPKPFGTLHFYTSEAFDVDLLDLEDAKKLVYEKMMINSIR
ncbi:MAG: lysophospholipid acyltransferase family protein [Arcobacter sp.]|nr:lysophospholipid acyltransferase family protein [Arcobacter sp.]